MTWEEAIHKVLEECPETLHYADIAERVVNENLVEYKGSAPAAGAASVLSTHISAGKGSFKKLGGGFYTLTDKAIADDEERDVIVACFGMFWERSRITWSTTPSISGMQYIGSDPVDFCNQVGVYLLYDGREVVYVGRTIDRPLGVYLNTPGIDCVQGGIVFRGSGCFQYWNLAISGICPIRFLLPK